jgi:hypothetical protein
MPLPFKKYPVFSPIKDGFGSGGGGATPGSAAPPKVTPESAAAPLADVAGGETSPPIEFRDDMKVVENWANANKRDAKNDLVAYWTLKLPAILVSASSSVLAHFSLDNIAVIAGAAAAACVLIDGLNPRGALRNVHRRAYNELSTLHGEMAAKWRVGALRGEDPKVLAARIIDESQPERRRISDYLTTAESALSDRRIDVGSKM